MRWILALTVPLVVAVIATGCGGGDSPIAVGDVEAPETPAPTTPPAPPPVSATADPAVQFFPADLRPDQPLHDGCVEPPAHALEASPPSRLSVWPEAVAAGSSLTVSWEVVAGDPVTTGNELVVSCWNGAGWMPVWFAFSIFSSSPRTVVLTAETIERYLFTADAWSETEGVVSIPPNAPPGTYRLTDHRRMLRSCDSQNDDERCLVAYLVVNPPGPGSADPS
ncbi:MAG: hypothetical protein AAF962_07565 [Actinomycetota bacterium]